MDDKQIIAFEAALVADGWHKDESSNIREYRRDGFTVMIAERYSITQGREWLDLAAWGSDGLAIEPPDIYSFTELKRRMSVCSECGAVGETVRLGFADRVCPDCRKRLAPTVKYPGWCS